MKTILYVLVAGFTLGVCYSTSAMTYVVGLSPYYTARDRELVSKQLLFFLLEGASANDTIVVYDAVDLKLVSSCTIPDLGRFSNNPRARATRLSSEIANLQRFIMTDRAHPVALDNVLHVPEFLALAGSQLRKPNERLQVILVGSPLYIGKEPGWNMNDATPSDGLILATATESAFGTADREHALVGVSVHYAYLHDSFVNGLHRERTGRTWALHIQQQQGALVTFAPELALALARAKQHLQQPCLTVMADRSDTKLEMRPVIARDIPHWLAQVPTNIYETVRAPIRDITNEPMRIVSLAAAATLRAPTNPPSASSTNVAVKPPVIIPSDLAFTGVSFGIGIRWDAPVDLDLWVRPRPGAQELSYRRRTTEEGKYFHDFHKGGRGVLDYEYCEITSDVDPQRVECWVNWYSGSSPSVTGNIAVLYRGKTYHSTFQILASKGNHGQDARERAHSPQWTKIDIAGLLRGDSKVAQHGP